MSTRNGRIGTLVGLGALVMFASSTVLAGQFGGSEDRLIGVTLRSSTYRDVLKKYGQPDEVQAGGPFVPVPPKDVAAASGGGNGGFAGGKAGGGPSMPGSGGGGMPGSGGGRPGGIGGGSSKRSTSKNGFPGKSDSTGGGTGGPTAGGSPGSGGYPGGYPGAGGYPGGSPGSGGYPGGAGSPGSGGYPGSAGGKGLPGFSGQGAGSPGAPGGAGLPGAGGEGGGGDQAEGPATETTWWYHNKLKGYHMSFLFNKNGRVIQIQEYGSTSLHGGKTRQGIMLGSNMTQVLGRYGWSNDGAHDGENVIMRYGENDKVAFQMVKNRVLGITVAVGH